MKVTDELQRVQDRPEVGGHGREKEKVIRGSGTWWRV